MVMEKGVAYGVGDCLVDKKLTFGNEVRGYIFVYFRKSHFTQTI